MSDTLSTLIAFVGFMIIFSMLVQTFQESLKNLWKLKSGVWERFFIRIYKKDFSLGSGIPTSFLTQICQNEFVGNYRTKMQRLKDIIVEYDNTLKDIKSILYDITHPSSDKVNFLDQLTPSTKKLAEDVQKLSGLKLDSLITIYDSLDNKSITNFSINLQDFIKNSPGFGQKITSAEQNLIPILQLNCKQLLDAIDTIEKKISDYRLQIENKFDDWMAQIDEEYRRNMLWWTFLIGLVFVLVFNADSFSIYKYLNVDTKAQATIVQMAADSTSKTLKSKAEILNDIDIQLKGKEIEKAKKAIISFSATLEKDFTNIGLTSNAESAAAINKNISTLKTDKAGNANDEVKNAAEELSRLFIVLQKASIDYQLKGVKSLELPLGWTDSYEEAKSLKGIDLILALLKKLAGLLLTTFLITFGAPFWNDILNALTGVKKVVQGSK